MNAKKLARASLAALLAAALLLSGCGYNPENVMTVDGEQVPAGRWLYYQMAALSAAVSELDDVTVTGAAVLEHEIDGVSARDWVRGKAIESCKRYVFIDSEFERLGLAFEASELEYIKSNVQMTWDYYAKDYYEANGIGYDTFMAVYLNSMKETKVREALYSEGGEKAISAEEKSGYFNENFAQLESFKLPVSDAAGFNLLENYPAEVHSLAERMLEKAKSDGITAAYLEFYGEALALAQSTETAVDETTAATAVTNSTIATALGYSDALCEAVLAAPIGSYGIVEADKTVYIYRRAELPADSSESDYDAKIVDALASEPFEEYIAAGTASYEVVSDEKALTYYSADKVKLA